MYSSLFLVAAPQQGYQTIRDALLASPSCLPGLVALMVFLCF